MQDDQLDDKRMGFQLAILNKEGWIKAYHHLARYLEDHMQKVITLMIDFKEGGVDGGHNGLQPKLAKLLMSDDVWEELKRASYQEFLDLFNGYDVEIYHQMVRSQVEGYIIVGAFSFEISLMVISKILGLVDEGLKITYDKHHQQTKLDFFTLKKKIGWDYKYKMQEGLHQLWLKVGGTIMNYFMVNAKMASIHGQHLVILNHIR